MINTEILRIPGENAIEVSNPDALGEKLKIKLPEWADQRIKIRMESDLQHFRTWLIIAHPDHHSMYYNFRTRRWRVLK